jgi:hypothetical protein
MPAEARWSSTRPDRRQSRSNIAAETARRKAESRPSLGTVFRGRMPRRAVLKIMERPRVNLASADVPGPHSRCISPGRG